MFCRVQNAAAIRLEDFDLSGLKCPPGGKIFYDSNLGIQKPVCIYKGRYYDIHTEDEILLLKDKDISIPNISKEKYVKGQVISDAGDPMDYNKNKYGSFRNRKHSGFNFGADYNLGLNSYKDSYGPMSSVTGLSTTHSIGFYIGYIFQVKNFLVGFRSHLNGEVGSSSNYEPASGSIPGDFSQGNDMKKNFFKAEMALGGVIKNLVSIKLLGGLGLENYGEDLNVKPYGLTGLGLEFSILPFSTVGIAYYYSFVDYSEFQPENTSSLNRTVNAHEIVASINFYF